MIVRNINMD